MVQANEVKEKMEVVCKMDENAAIGRVDRVEGDKLKLAKDHTGQHHYIPLAWVEKVDNKVHLDRAGQDAMKEWTTS